MIAQISELAARTIMEGWFKIETNEGGVLEGQDIGELMKPHFPGTVGDVFDADTILLVHKEDGWYVASRDYR